MAGWGVGGEEEEGREEEGREEGGGRGERGGHCVIVLYLVGNRLEDDLICQ